MKGRKNRSTGGVNQSAQDLASSPTGRNIANPVTEESRGRKSGGACKSGGSSNQGFGPESQGTMRKGRKAGGLVPGDASAPNAGRKPRKSGGRTTSDMNPFTSARSGTPAKGRKVLMEAETL